MLFSALRSLVPEAGNEAVHAAQRRLRALSAVAVVSALLLAAIGATAVTWTYRALQSADHAVTALRAHAKLDNLHDTLRAELVAAALGHTLPPNFEEHAVELEYRLGELQAIALPAPQKKTINELAPRLRAYVATGREILRDKDVTLTELEMYTNRWQALEDPLDALGDQLHALVIEAEHSGARTYRNALLLIALGLLLTTVGLVYTGRRISHAVLETNRQLLEATERANRASQSRADFLAAMSHEIRTPLTGVLGLVDLLAAEDLTPRQKSYAESLRSSGRHLLAVINDILDFTRIESGKLEVEHIDFSLPDVLERVRSLVHPQAAERRLKLDLELRPQSPPIVKGDPTRIQQVLLNLTTNAIKFTERGGVHVAVAHLAREGSALRYRFEVRDTGVGIAPDKQAHLFDAFRQADQSIARRFGGSGLGLAICKRLVEAMGGSIGVDSTPGRGSLFFFELPLGIGDVERVTPRKAAEPRAATPRRILIVEDVEVNRRILGTTLERAGHTLVFAHDGVQAVAHAGVRPFDLILMDVQMPLMDGMEATRRIRQGNGPNRATPILALTANVMTQERERYLSAGMDECLTKPIDWQQLHGAIERHTAGRQQAAAPAPAPEAAPPPPVAEVPCIDARVLASLQDMAGRDVLRDWLATGMHNYERSSEAIASPGADASTQAAEAHKAKGSSSTLGLARIARAAAQVEEAANGGGGTVPPGLVAALQEAVVATRQELREMDLL